MKRLTIKRYYYSAINEHKASILLTPTVPHPYHGLGNALYDKGDRDGALAAYQEAIRRGIRLSVTYNNVPIFLSEHKKSFGALQVLRDGPSVNPNFIADFRYNLACIACLIVNRQAKDAPASADPAGLRCEALGWLTDDLPAQQILATDAKNRAIVHKTIQGCRTDDDLGSVRDVAKFPMSEREKRAKLWSTVR